MDKFSFAHVGFGKSGSTALQTIWSRSSNCNYFSAHGLVESARNIILQNLHDLDAMVHKLNSLNLAQVNLASDGANILSSEGITFGWLDDPNLSNAIPLKQKALANVLAPLCNNVLVVTRDPIHWIRSAYAQVIKEGGMVSIEHFVDRNKENIMRNLDLGAILKFWSEHGCDPVVLPFEMFRSEPDIFWNAYSRELGVAIPDATNEDLSDFERNATSYESLDVHASLNELLHALETLVAASNVADSAKVAEFLHMARKWGVRRALASANETDLKAIKGVLSPSHYEKYISTAPTRLDNSLVSELTHRYLDPLSEMANEHTQRYCDEYRASLSFGSV